MIHCREAAADTAALAAILIPMMREARYNIPRSAGLIAAGGIIAPVIPPSIGFVVFGVAAAKQASAAAALQAAQPELMRGAQKGVLHKNTASRLKSSFATPQHARSRPSVQTNW